MKKKVIAILVGTIILGGLSDLSHSGSWDWTGYIAGALFAIAAMLVAYALWKDAEK